MKSLLFLLSLFCLSAFGSGKLTVDSAYHYSTGQPEPKIGINVYEPLFLDVHYDAWLGVGWYVGSCHNTAWGMFKQKVKFPLSEDLSIAPSFTIRQAESRSPGVEALLSASEVAIGLEYKLW